MSAIGNPSPKDIKNFQENFCSGPLDDEKFKLFNPNKINIATLKKAGISQPSNQSELELLRDNVRKVHDYVQNSDNRLTPQQEKIYQTNYKKLEHLISPKPLGLEHYEIRDKNELEWIHAKWLSQDRTNFRNLPSSISSEDFETNPWHLSIYRQEKEKKDLDALLDLDLPRGHWISIKSKAIPEQSKSSWGEGEASKKEKRLAIPSKVEEFPSVSGQKQPVEEQKKELGLLLKRLGFSEEKDSIAYFAIKSSLTQRFHLQMQGIYAASQLVNLQETFPVYYTQNHGFSRTGNLENLVDTNICMTVFSKTEQPPVIIDCDKRTSSSTVVFSYVATGPFFDTPEPLMYIGTDTELEWDTGKVTIANIRPLAIRNLKSGEIEVLEKPDIPFRTNTWQFPPERKKNLP